MSAPKPLNFKAMAAAWDNPIAFARELNKYYAQLAESGSRTLPPDWTDQNKEDQGTAQVRSKP